MPPLTLYGVEDTGDQTSGFSCDTNPSARLAQIGTREPGGECPDFVRHPKRSDVVMDADRGEVPRKDRARCLIDLAESGCDVTGSPEPEFQPPNTGEQPGNVQATRPLGVVSAEPLWKMVCGPRRH